MQIENLFDPTKDIYRRIEKVISYGASQEDKIKAEISEYVVTDSIERQLEKLLDKMDLAMGSGENEIGVWVSGFYGSGKSSFTKYLGFAFDETVQVQGVPFLQRLQDRLKSPQVKAQLGAVAKRYPATIVMLDLASEMLAGANKTDISSVLYFKVLQWAGYSRNLKIAALERKIEKDNKWNEFEGKLKTYFPELTWTDLQNDPLIVDALIPQIAHDLYPVLFPTNTSFNANTADFLKSEDQQVQEMIEIVREKSGKEYIIFVVDEVGQYVASGENLILNLDGLAKNLKRIGEGKVWIISTAQQTLTEDDARAAINAAGLYKLKDRFPIQVDLESHDIKEICTRRLLGKSTSGETELDKLFDAHGAALKYNTKLQDAKYYESELDKRKFVDLYPFLPAHFDILLQLLGALAKSTGGYGLRSAIKVVQDILIEGLDGRVAVAKEQLGWLATTVTLFDALDKDIQKSFSSIYSGLAATRIRFPNSEVHENVAKTIVILQILNTLPITAQNIAALIHPAISSPSLIDETRKSIDEMLREPQVPLSEKDGYLYFLSAKLNEIERERGELPLRIGEVRRIFNENLRDVFDPLPRFNLFHTFTVTSGIKILSGNILNNLAGDQNPIQTIIELAKITDYEAAKVRITTNSSQTNNQKTIYLLGAEDPKADELAAEIYRCQRIIELHNHEPDQEIKDYRDSQKDRIAKLSIQLQQLIKSSLKQGTFIFRGSTTAITTLNSDLLLAANKFTGEVAEQVFDRFNEASVRVETTLPEKFLKVGDPSSIAGELDPLSLFVRSGGKPSFNTDHKAVVSIRDYIEHHGAVIGKRLLDNFNDPPFGWSNDTIRYIVAAMLLGGEIKLTISGRDVTTVGQKAIDALKTNKTFYTIGVSLRDERPSMDSLARASERLTKLIGEMVVPIEQEISQKALKKAPQFQSDFAPLGEKLSTLELIGKDRIEDLQQELKAITDSDGAEATVRFGGEISSLYDNLSWAGEVKKAFANGLESTLKELQTFRLAKQNLADSGIPGKLSQELSEIFETIKPRLEKDDFYLHTVEFNSALTDAQAKVAMAANELRGQLKKRLTDGGDELQLLPEWQELLQEERDNSLNQLNNFSFECIPGLGGFNQLQSKDFDITNTLTQIKNSVRQIVHERLRKRIEEEIAETGETKVRKLTRAVPVKARLINPADLDQLIYQLQEIKSQSALYTELEINIIIEE